MPAEPQSNPPSPELQDLERLFREAVPGMKFEADFHFDELTLTVAPEDIRALCLAAKGYSKLGFDFLHCLSAVEEEDRFSLVYHLHSTRKAQRVVLKTEVPRDRPVAASVTSVWRGADWHEREAAEMFGLEFQGHPHPAPLLLWVGFQGHPLRKDFHVGGLEETGEG